MFNSDNKDFIEEKISCKIDAVERLTGGDINSVYLLKTEKENLVLKANKKDKFPEMLEKEFRALRYFCKESPLKFPRPINHFEDDSSQYLLMEYIAPGKSTTAAVSKLGTDLARQHKISDSLFGWTEDNFIGSAVQKNDRREKWSEFYAEFRIIAQIKTAYNQKLIDKKFLKQAENLCSRLSELFPEEPPALLHGDLWGGNYFIDREENPVLYDPAVYFGHREMDIGMTLLFGGFSESFYENYQEKNPLEKDWQQRVELTQLYPNLVHLNLFGTAYLSAVSAILKKF